MINLYEFQHAMFNYVVYLTYFLYILIALGLSASAPRYLDDLLFYTKLYISVFLVYRFNPYTLVKFTPLDAKIAYNAGLFLLFSVAVDSLLKKYIDWIKKTYFAKRDEIKKLYFS
jgi:hypothetical protein